MYFQNRRTVAVCLSLECVNVYLLKYLLECLFLLEAFVVCRVYVFPCILFGVLRFPVYFIQTKKKLPFVLCSVIVSFIFG